MCLVVFKFFISWITPSHASLIHFCVAELNTPGASIVPSPSCEVPPQQGNKVLEAGTRYPWKETARLSTTLVR